MYAIMKVCNYENMKIWKYRNMGICRDIHAEKYKYEKCKRVCKESKYIYWRKL